MGVKKTNRVSFRNCPREEGGGGGNWRNLDFRGGHDCYRCDKVSQTPSGGGGGGGGWGMLVCVQGFIQDFVGRGAPPKFGVDVKGVYST